jgi:hypothetical protein
MTTLRKPPEPQVGLIPHGRALNNYTLDTNVENLILETNNDWNQVFTNDDINGAGNELNNVITETTATTSSMGPEAMTTLSLIREATSCMAVPESTR